MKVHSPETNERAGDQQQGAWVPVPVPHVVCCPFSWVVDPSDQLIPFLCVAALAPTVWAGCARWPSNPPMSFPREGIDMKEEEHRTLTSMFFARCNPQVPKHQTFMTRVCLRGFCKGYSSLEYVVFVALMM